MDTIQKITGMRDILPDRSFWWRHLEQVCAAILDGYGYHQLRMPLLEKTQLFKRSIGEVTDIVEKEMYTFQDLDGDSLTLRPEGTASCVRALIEHHLHRHNPLCKLWYQGPMFRHESAQRWRYRQFSQIGVEVFGSAQACTDAELILMGTRMWRLLELGGIRLELNTLGDLDDRKRYREALVAYLQEHRGQLDEDSLRRLQTNPLRILDSKVESVQAVVQNAPVLSDYLNEQARDHFAELRNYLDENGLEYTVNPRLVRGLDYYNRTVFEWLAEDEEGSQNAVCSGGRYDTLVEQLGGPSLPAAGFALGEDRVIELMSKNPRWTESQPPADCYMVMVGQGTMRKGMQLAETLRDRLPNMRLLYHMGSGSFKSQMKRADKSGAKLALILGENELQQGQIGIKLLRESTEQLTVSVDSLAETLNSYL